MTNSTQYPSNQSNNEGVHTMTFSEPNGTFTLDRLSTIVRFQSIAPIDVDLPSFHFFEDISAAASGDNLYIIGNKFIKSKDSGEFFWPSDPIFEITEGKTPVSGLKIAASGNNVYLLWQNSTNDNSNIYFRASTDNGFSFGKIVDLTEQIRPNTHLKDSLKIAASGNNVYVAWGNSTTLLFRASTDNGVSFSNTTVLSNNSGNPFPNILQIIPSLNNVYITWEERTDGKISNFFRASTDNGTNFNDTINISDKVMNSTFTEIAASGDNVYGIWTAGPGFSPVDLFYSKSSDAGRSFGPLLKVNRENGTDIQARVAAYGNNVYIAWTPDSRFWHGTIPDLLLTRSTDNGTNFEQPVKLLNQSEARFIAGEGPSIELFASGNKVFVIGSLNFRHIGESHIFVIGSTDKGANFVRTYIRAVSDPYFVAGNNTVYNLVDRFRISLPDS